MMMTAGPMACGEVSPIFPPCVVRRWASSSTPGAWMSVDDALNGQPINPGQVLGASF